MAVTHQNPAIAQGLNELRVHWANPHQHEIGVTRPVVQPEVAKFLLQSLAVTQHLCDIAADILLILQSLGQNCESRRVDVVRRGNAPHHRHLPRLSRKNANSQTSEAIGLGKGSRHEKILDLPGLAKKRLANKRTVNQRFSMKFEICLIDKQSGLWRCLRNLNEDIAATAAPVGLLGFATAISLVRGLS